MARIPIQEIQETSDCLTTTKRETFRDGSIQQKGRPLGTVLYDTGWEVFIDGKKVGTKNADGAFVGVHVEKGRHEVVFRFIPGGFRQGMFISAMSLVIFVVIVCFI